MTSFCLELFTPVADDLPVYISGNFNNWHPKDPCFQMQHVSAGKYSFCFSEGTILPDPLEYKYTKGGWGFVELDAEGNSTPNRIITQPTDKQHDTVINWRRNDMEFDPAFLPKIYTISDAFESPQLKRARRVIALLPYNYDQTSRYYPVLYMHDAQNLFDENAPYGNWAIDKRLAVLAEKGRGEVIIVAIDHAGDKRIQEFSPYETTQWGRGQGRRYINFLVQTLKPHIDATLRTLPERQHTGIGGSSMGGLISVYAGLMYPQTFGRLMIFSPSLWVSPKIYFDAIEFFNPSDTRIYLYAGARESSTMIPNITRLKETLERRGIDHGQLQFEVSINPKGRHNEVVWGEEFPKAIEWLFY